MTPTEIIREAKKAGVILTLSSADTIKAIGDNESVKRWSNIIREHKTAIIEILKTLTDDAAILGMGYCGSKDKQHLTEFVQRCCVGFSISTHKVIDGLLSTEDEADIINGGLPTESLRLFIELWLANGMPHISGKPN